VKKLTVFLGVLIATGLQLFAAPAAKTSKEPVDWVDPLIGTTNPGLR